MNRTCHLRYAQVECECPQGWVGGGVLTGSEQIAMHESADQLTCYAADVVPMTLLYCPLS